MIILAQILRYGKRRHWRRSVHAFEQRNKYIMGHFFEGKLCTNEQTMKYICLESAKTKYIKNSNYLKLFLLGIHGFKKMCDSLLACSTGSAQSLLVQPVKHFLSDTQFIISS